MIKYEKKYTDKSFDIDKCRESALSGYASAQYQIGQCYEEGIDVERNLAKAFKLYWLASDNCRPAKERLDKDSYQGQLVKWLKKAVNGKLLAGVDLAEAMCMLGCCYQHGWGVDCDLASAVEWWQQAADMGDAYANDRLGYCYSHGQGGLPKDAVQAFLHYLKAAEGGYFKDYFSVGLCYKDGDGVERDDEKAFGWFKKAAEHDNPMAWVELGNCYATGSGMALDCGKAVVWYRKAVDLGGNAFPDALRGLGNCYAAGHGVEQDWNKAVELYSRAARADDPESQYLLARCYAEGHGVKQDMEEAVRLYKKAATNINENKRYYGHPEAMRSLGDCYANGIGVRKNAKQAAAWYAKAAEQENEE
ncbi:tetratricopeptide repeat protein [Xylanibacter rodentium]|mgnify:FL=1|jgi:hypothetical protein|uniref:Sel1 repeat family protein n=3 Tax=Xylanibacter rodentium TaxID=2736289 RepID=A0ABX2ASM4_9BACT|nr:tetratricopeptide repeat protein [Xylanibacter rodentium]NPE11289.1 sel1 repeat family protein [Prevotella sp. PJ1A]NPE13556.1 sel1 repeat family protein [Xylanibacter rodentium]NPE38282.1 sel1 repeat family protein [Prevotella sp. PCJ2]